jgi:hypothetical protein
MGTRPLLTPRGRIWLDWLNVVGSVAGAVSFLFSAALAIALGYNYLTDGSILRLLGGDVYVVSQRSRIVSGGEARSECDKDYRVISGYCRLDDGASSMLTSSAIFQPQDKAEQFVCAWDLKSEGQQTARDAAQKAGQDLGRFQIAVTVGAACMLGQPVCWGSLYAEEPSVSRHKRLRMRMMVGGTDA